MAGFDFTPDEEQQLYSELGQIDSKTKSYQSTASPVVGRYVGDFAKAHPYAAPGTVLAVSKAVANNQMSSDQANNLLYQTSKTALENTNTEPPKKKSWYERNIGSKIKTASRYTMAGLNFIPQTVQGAAAQIFDENEDINGWFISTDLGSLIENDKEAGDGYFVGGNTAKLQAERAKRYRGEIDGHAFTIGRGFAHVLTQPGSREYNILSGLVDAGVALGVPSVPGAAVVKGGIKSVSAQTGLRTVAGLSDAESALINVSKVSNFLSSSSGKSVINRISEIKDLDEAMQIFESVGDTRFWVDIVDKADEARQLGDNTVITNYLQDTLGLSGPRTVDSINISRFDDVKRSMVGRSSLASKMMAKVPGGHIVLQGGNTRDVASSVKNLNNYLVLFKGVSKDERNLLVMDYARAATVEDGNMFPVVEQIQKIINRSMQDMGVPDEAINQLSKGMKNYTEGKAVYGAVDNLSGSTNFGGKIILTDGSLVDMPKYTAALESEMLNSLYMTLPDARRVRRMNSDIGWIFGKQFNKDTRSLQEELKRISDIKIEKDGSYIIDGKNLTPAQRKKLISDIGSDVSKGVEKAQKFGELRFPIAALEAIQQEIWRPITLLTGGYVLRNLSDSAIRISSTRGMEGGIFHPIDWIQIAMKKRFKGDLLGANFEREAEEFLTQAMDEYSEAMNVGLREIDPVNLAKKQKTDKNWEIVDRNTDVSGKAFSEGVANEMSLMGDDLVTRELAKGTPPNDVVKLLLDNNPESQKYLRSLQSRWKNREFPQTDSGIGSVDILDAQGKITAAGEQNIRNFVNNYANKRLSYYTGDNQILRDAVANGKFIDDAGETQSIYIYRQGGSRAGYNPLWEKKVRELTSDPNIRLAEKYKRRITLDEMKKGGADMPQTRKILESFNKTTQHFFSSLYPKRSSYLMQSPAFRQYYYKQVENLFDELDTVGFNSVIDNLKKAAKTEKKVLDKTWLTRYVGDSNVADKILLRMDSPVKGGGRLTLTQLDSYAKGYALDETQKLFYNASEKSNFADILRIVAPFGSAWSEVMKSWTKIVLNNPEALKRAGVTVQGLKNADPDADGKGFFWKDPVSGEYVFNYPFNEQLGPLRSYFGGIGAVAGLALGGLPGAGIGAATGLGVGQGLQSLRGDIPGVNLIAPAKTLTMGFNVIPGVGPFVQIAASKILGQIPQADSLRKLIAPYGEPDATLIPSWGKKFLSSFANPENNRKLGDMTLDVMRVLEKEGDYDLSSDAEKERLYNDSIGRARTLLMLSALGQFTGPSRPDVEFKTATDKGDMFANELVKAFRTMQTDNYDTSIETFLNTFGDDAFLYVAGKTKSAVGGLDASTKFGNFERSNTSLFSRYGDVAGYLSPVGTNFDYQVYIRQLDNGSRVKLKPSQLVEEAQSLVGRALYRQVVRGFGTDKSDEAKNKMRAIRELLKKEYPGFATSPIDVNKLSSQLVQLEKAVNDPITEGNVIAEAAKLYFDARNQVLVEAQNRGFTTLAGKQVSDLRVMLRNIGDLLVKQYPEFGRLFDRVLFNEIDVDFGDTP